MLHVDHEILLGISNHQFLLSSNTEGTSSAGLTYRSHSNNPYLIITNLSFANINTSLLRKEGGLHEEHFKALLREDAVLWLFSTST